jgi:hypothetical protein
MDNLVKNLPQIIEKASSLFGIFVLIAIVVAVIVILLFRKDDPTQKKQIFIYTICFFGGLMLFALGAGFLSGFKSGGDNVTAIIAKDPSQLDSSLVNLSPSTTKNLEKYLIAKGEPITQEGKTKVLEASVEAYTNPTPITSPTPEVKPTPISTPTNSVVPKPNPTLISTSTLSEVSSTGFLWKLSGCYLQKDKLTCNLTITSQDKNSSFDNIQSGTELLMLYDNRGNFYRTSSIQIGNKFYNDCCYMVPFIANVETPMQVIFENIVKSASSVSEFTIKVKTKGTLGDVTFKNSRFIPETAPNPF